MKGSAIARPHASPQQTTAMRAANRSHTARCAARSPMSGRASSRSKTNRCRLRRRIAGRSRLSGGARHASGPRGKRHDAARGAPLVSRASRRANGQGVPGGEMPSQWTPGLKTKPNRSSAVESLQSPSAIARIQAAKELPSRKPAHPEPGRQNPVEELRPREARSPRRRRDL